MSQPIDSKAIAAGVAATTAIFLVIVHLPIIGFFCSLLLPLPILFFRYKDGRHTAAIIGAVVLMGATVIYGSLSFDLLFFLMFLLIGFVLGELFEQGQSLEVTVLTTVGAALGTGLAGLFVYSTLAGTGLVALISDYVLKNLEMTLDIYEGMGVSEDSMHRIASSLDEIHYVLLRVLPAMAVASLLFVVWTSMLLAKPIFRSRALPYPDFGVMNQWKAPEALVWVAIGCGLLLFVPARPLKIVGLNGVIVLMMIYFFQGIAIVSFFFEKKQFPFLLRVVLYSLIGLQQFLLLLVIGFGFFDMWLNFRKMGTNRGA